MSMKPICAQVLQASITLMLMRVVITSAASTAVAVPAVTSSTWAAGTSATSGAKRMSTKPPRLTTPACSSAETGVGASITWISQPWKGSCAHLSTAAQAMSSTAACAAPGNCVAAAARAAS